VSFQAIKDLIVKSGGSDILNTADGDGDTPLHVAARSGDKHLCVFLISQGSNPLKRNKKNRTPASQANLEEDVKEYLVAEEATAKQSQKLKLAGIWDEKMRATQTQNACGVGGL
jgi:ankyrin repeat protein